MRSIEKLYDACSRNKLTISLDRVVIRFKQGASPDELDRVEKFLSKVAHQAPDCETTIRGHLAHHLTSDTFYIVLKNQSKTYSKRFFETEV